MRASHKYTEAEEKVIIFEEFSLFKFLLLYREIKQEGSIYLLDCSPFTNKKPDVSNIQSKTGWFIPGLKVKVVDRWEFPQAHFLANRDLPGRVNRKVNGLTGFPAFKMLNQYYKADGLSIAFKKVIHYQLRQTNYFRKVVKLLSENKNVVTAVPVTPDYFKILPSWPNKDLVPKRVKLAHFLIEVKRVIWSVVVWLGVLFHNIPRVIFKAQTKFSSYAQVIVWPNVDEKENVAHLGHYKVRYNRWNSFYLEDGVSFTAKDILYILHHWRFDKNVENVLRNHIKDKGGACCIAWKLPPDLQYLIKKQIVGFGLYCMPYIALSLLLGVRYWQMLGIGIKLMHHLNQWEIFCRHYRPKVMMGYDDQSYSHIARTMVFDNYGLKNIGINHPAHAGLVLGPETAFIYFHHFFNYSFLEKKLYAPFWDGQDTTVTGPLRTDLIYESMSNDERRASFRNKYGDSKLIVVAPPGPSLLNDPKRTADFYKGLARLAEMRDDFVYILRPRPSYKLAGDYECMLKPLMDSGRLYLELDEFDTYELMAYSDLVITIHSTLMQEALIAGLKVFCFLFNHLDELYTFYKFNPLLTTTSSDELVSRANYFLDSEDPINNLQQIRDSMGVPFDGCDVQRMRQAIARLSKAE